jgi:hypothetical protein
VRRQRIGVVKCLGDLACQVVGQAAVAVDAGEFGQFGLRVGGQFALFFGAVAAFDVDLGAHRDVFSGGHGHRSGGQSGDARGQYRGCCGAAGCHADHQAGCGDQAVVGAEHRGA